MQFKNEAFDFKKDFSFKEEGFNFKENIQFKDESKVAKPGLKEDIKIAMHSTDKGSSIGAKAINTVDKMNEVYDEFNSEYHVGEDTLDKAIRFRSIYENRTSSELRNNARAHKKEAKRLSKESKSLNKPIETAAEKLNHTREVYDRLHNKMDDAKFELDNLKKNGASKDEISKATAKYNEAKDDFNYIKGQEITETKNLEALKNKQESIDANKALEKKEGKSDSKDAKKSDRKKAALNVIASAKKEAGNVNGESSDDLIASGKSGITGTILKVLNPLEHIKERVVMYLTGIITGFITSIVTFIVGTLLPLIATVALVAFIFYFAVVSFASFTNGIVEKFTGGNVQYESMLSDDEIHELLLDRGWRWEYVYDDTDGDGKQELVDQYKVSTLPQWQQDIINYSLSKVGYAYSQDYRMDGPNGGSYFDCSSLAYATELSVGKNITSSCAADQAKKLKNSGKMVETMTDLEIGDLIYYGGHNNGRFLGIYHVAVYVGNGYCVEAFSTGKGVIYTPIRNKNAIMVCRP